jgi:hypothetical protein
MPTPEERKERERVQKLNELELLTKRMKITIIELRKQLKSLEERYISSKFLIKQRVSAVEGLEKISDKMIQSLKKDLETVSKRLEKIESTDWNKSKKDLERAVLEQQRRMQTQQQNIQMLARSVVNLKNNVRKAFKDQRELNTTIAKNFEILTGLVKALKKKKSELEAAEAMTEISKTGQESDGSSSRSGNKKRKGMRTLKL